MIPLIKDKNIEIVKIENMSKKSGNAKLIYDTELDKSIGNVKKLEKTLLYNEVVKNLNIITGEKL
jgi:hypothetical protein